MARNVDIINQQGTEFGPPFFVFVGHSLGGAAAQCLCGRVANSRSISLNVSLYNKGWRGLHESSIVWPWSG